MHTDSEDQEITLASSDLRLKVSPFGASLRGLWREPHKGSNRDIITGYTGAAGKVGGQGDVLIPFPGRVRDGRYTFDGQSYQMVCNDKDGPNAIHGFLRLLSWEVAHQSEYIISFVSAMDASDHPGYPFSLRSSVTYALSDIGMTCNSPL